MQSLKTRGFSRIALIHRLMILGILLVAAWLRWAKPGLVEFKYDEAHIFGMARGIATGHFWPVLSGGTSIGLPRAALDAYLLAIPLALTGGSPQAAIIWLGMWGVTAVALTYVLGRLVAGPRVGLLAAAYMGLNPWLVFYDRKFWAHIQVVFSVLLLLLAWRVVVKDSGRARFWFPIVAALQLLTHVLALVQVLNWLGAGLVAPRRWWRKEALWGALAGVAVLLPYLAALAHRAIQASTPQVVAVTTHAIARDQTLSDRWRLAWQLISGDRIFELTGSGIRTTSWDAMLAWGGWMVGVVTLFGVGVTLARWLRPRGDGLSKPSAILLLAWGVGPWLALSLGPAEVYLQYWTVLLPLPALFFAIGLDWAWRRLMISRYGSAENPVFIRTGGAALAIGLLLFIWAGGWLSVLGRIDAGAGLATFGRPLRAWQEALDEANGWAQKLGLDQVKVLAQGVDPGQDGEPAAIASLIGNPPYARFLELRDPMPGLLLHASQPSLYLTTSSAMNPILETMGKEIWRGEGVAPLRLFLLPSASEAEVTFHVLAEPQAFDVGATLIGYYFPEPWPMGQPVQAMLVWRMDDVPETTRERDYTAFNHIVRLDSGNKVAQVDGMAMLSRDWWPDDVLYQFYTVVIPEEGAFQWLVGLYSRTDGNRAHLSSGDDHVSLPLQVER